MPRELRMGSQIRLNRTLCRQFTGPQFELVHGTQKKTAAAGKREPLGNEVPDSINQKTHPMRRHSKIRPRVPQLSPQPSQPKGLPALPREPYSIRNRAYHVDR